MVFHIPHPIPQCWEERRLYLANLLAMVMWENRLLQYVNLIDCNLWLMVDG
jgi:hypothetical protein